MKYQLFSRMNYSHPLKQAVITSTPITNPSSTPAFSPPSIVCDGVLTRPSTPNEPGIEQQNLHQLNFAQLPHPSSASLLEPNNLNSTRNSTMGSQQQLSGVGLLKVYEFIKKNKCPFLFLLFVLIMFSRFLHHFKFNINISLKISKLKLYYCFNWVCFYNHL